MWIVTRKFRGRLTYWNADMGLWSTYILDASPYRNETVARCIAFVWDGEVCPVETGVPR